jgi:hypothetical protein
VGAEAVEVGDVDGEDLLGVEADDEGPGVLAVDHVVVGLFVVEGDALDDPGVLEEAEGSVDGGLADTTAVLAGFVEDSVGLEDAIEAHDDVEEARAFGGVLEPFALEASAKDGAERVEDAEGGRALGRGAA